MYYIYILKSINFNQQYIGFTKDLKTRLASHNAGHSRRTKKYKPWQLITYIAFENEERARSFEEYLKTGSGIAFTRKHLIRT